MFKCEICGRIFSLKHHLIRHYKHKHKDIDTNKQIYDLNHLCKYCGVFIENNKSLGNHSIFCEKNPNYENNKASFKEAGKKQVGSVVSEETKLKIKNTINEKIKNGTWHTSFSKKRTYEYNGIKFHGSWEYAFAQYLDNNNKKWRRPHETFQYILDDKVHRYTPDFFLIDENCYYEIKGYVTKKDIAKWNQFPFKLKILLGKDLCDLGVIDIKCRNQKIQTKQNFNC